MTVGRKPLDVLLAAVCHGTADQSQLQQLAELLQHDTQAMDEYLRQVDLHVLLATDPALGLASAREDTTGSVRLAKARSRSRRRVVQAVSVAVVATGMVLAALVVFERTGNSRQRSVVTPTESQFDPTIAVVRPPTVVIEEPMPSSSANERPTQQREQSPQQRKQSPQYATELTSPPAGSRWTGTPRSFASRLASNERSEFRLLPARYHVPRSDHLIGGSRRIVTVFQTAVASRADSDLPGTDALVEKRPTAHWSRSRDGWSPSQRPPSWRRDLDSQLSMNINSMKLDWRKIHEN